MARIITLTGPSQAGKSTAIDYFLSIKSNGYTPKCIKKYSTRDPRDDDKKIEIECVEELPNSCDLVYQQYDSRYGIEIKSIIENLNKGITSIIILNDVRTITEVKRIFGEICTSVFMYRHAPDINTFNKISKKRGVNDISDIQKRLKKAEAIYRIYIENIYLFNHVIINSKGKRELKKQITSIINFNKNLNLNYFK